MIKACCPSELTANPYRSNSQRHNDLLTPFKLKVAPETRYDGPHNCIYTQPEGARYSHLIRCGHLPNPGNIPLIPGPVNSSS